MNQGNKRMPLQCGACEHAIFHLRTTAPVLTCECSVTGKFHGSREDMVERYSDDFCSRAVRRKD